MQKSYSNADPSSKIILLFYFSGGIFSPISILHFATESTFFNTKILHKFRFLPGLDSWIRLQLKQATSEYTEWVKENSEKKEVILNESKDGTGNTTTGMIGSKTNHPDSHKSTTSKPTIDYNNTKENAAATSPTSVASTSGTASISVANSENDALKSIQGHQRGHSSPIPSSLLQAIPEKQTRFKLFYIQSVLSHTNTH